MDTAQGYPAELQLGVFPQLCFCGEVPLPVICNVVAVLDSCRRRAASRPEKQGLSRASRTNLSTHWPVEGSITSPSNGSGSVDPLHLHKKRYRIAGKKLTDAAAQGEFAGAENIPRKSQARSEKVIVGGHQVATIAHYAPRTIRTLEGVTLGQDESVARRIAE